MREFTWSKILEKGRYKIVVHVSYIKRKIIIINELIMRKMNFKILSLFQNCFINDQDLHKKYQQTIFIPFLTYKKYGYIYFQ